MRFLYVENVWCWLIVAALAIAAVVGMARTIRARRRFLDDVQSWRLWAKAAMRTTAAALLGITAMGPSWGERTLDEPPRQGRDVLVLLDVSRSMLAEDANPNRLEAAKAGVRRL